VVLNDIAARIESIFTVILFRVNDIEELLLGCVSKKYDAVFHVEDRSKTRLHPSTQSLMVVVRIEPDQNIDDVSELHLF